MIREFVGHRAVRAPGAVQPRVEVVASLEGACRVENPLVQVTHHVVDAIIIGAARVPARLGDGALDLVEGRLDSFVRRSTATVSSRFTLEP